MESGVQENRHQLIERYEAMSRRFLQRGVVTLCMLAGVLVLSASRDNSKAAAEAASTPAPQQQEEPLLDFALPFDMTVHCFVNGEDHVVVVHRRIRLFFLPMSPHAVAVRKTQIMEECE